jgi:predicted aspartyl protease
LKSSSRRPQAIKINETWANNEGLFVKAKLQKKCLSFLIDTGANVTILSKQFIENIQPSLLSQVNPLLAQVSLIFIAWGLLEDA